MVDGDREPLTGRVLDERLDERRAVLRVDERRIDRAVEDGEVAERADRAGLVDEPHLDRVGSDEAGRDVVVRTGAGSSVEPGNEIGHRRVVTVVLLLDQAEDVGIEFEHRGHDLRPLTVEFGHAVGATAVEGATRPTRTAAAARCLVDRREVVEHVEARHLDRPADVVGRRGLRIDRVERVVVLGGDRSDPPGIGAGLPGEAPVHHAGEVVDRVTAAELVAERQAALGVVERLIGPVGDRVVLVVVVVVEDDPTRRQIIEEGRVPGDARRVEVGELERTRRFGQDDLAVPGELEVLADDQRVGERREHAFDVLEGGFVDRAPARRKVDGRWRGERIPGALDDGRTGSERHVDLAHAEELRGVARRR